MLDSSCRHDVSVRPEPRLRQNTAIDNYLQAAADLTGDVIEVAGSHKLGHQPVWVGAATVPRGIRPFPEERS